MLGFDPLFGPRSVAEPRAGLRPVSGFRIDGGDPGLDGLLRRPLESACVAIEAPRLILEAFIDQSELADLHVVGALDEALQGIADAPSDGLVVGLLLTGFAGNAFDRVKAFHQHGVTVREPCAQQLADLVHVQEAATLACGDKEVKVTAIETITRLWVREALGSTVISDEPSDVGVRAVEDLGLKLKSAFEYQVVGEKQLLALCRSPDEGLGDTGAVLSKPLEERAIVKRELFKRARRQAPEFVGPVQVRPAPGDDMFPGVENHGSEICVRVRDRSKPARRVVDPLCPEGMTARRAEELPTATGPPVWWFGLPASAHQPIEAGGKKAVLDGPHEAAIITALGLGGFVRPFAILWPAWFS